MVELQNLCSLLNVVEHGSITEAAKIENISQPAMSKRVQSVSTGFNTQVFKDDYSYQSLTEEGRIIVKGAADIRNIYLKMQRDLNNATRSIRIGISQECSTGYLYRNLSNFCSFQNKRVRVTTYKDSHFEIIKMLNDKLIDMAIIKEEDYRSLKDSSYYEIGKAITGQMGVVLPRGIPLAKKASATVKDLSYYPAILPSNPTSIPSVIRWFGEAGLPQVAYEASSEYELLEAVASGLGYAFVPLEISNIISNRFAVIPLAPKIEIKSRIITSTNIRITNTMHDFVKYMSYQHQVF